MHATRAAAHARLARMLCMDGETCPAQETRRLAQQVMNRQVSAIRSALDRVVQRLPAAPDAWLLSGSGEFVARRVVEGSRPGKSARVIGLGEQLGPEASSAACAHAAAVLLKESV